MSHLHSHFLTTKSSFIYLTNRARGYGLTIYLVEKHLRWLVVHPHKYLLGFFIGMFRWKWSQDLEAFSQILTNYISSVTHMLEYLNPNNTRFWNRPNKAIHPNNSCPFKNGQRKQENAGKEYKPQLDKSYNIA